MTTPPPVFAQFGRALAFAERTMTATLREHLAARDTQPETWYALSLIGSAEHDLSRETLAADLEGSRTLTPDSVQELLARLEAEGLSRGDAVIELTAEGDARYRSLREYISQPTARLLGQFDVHDVETTIRTLQAITARAQEELALST
jgi:hypothetical protein